MSLGPEILARFESESDVDWWEALILSHPRAGSFYITNAQEEQIGRIDGELQTFSPVAFLATLPNRDGEGQQDMQIAVCNIGSEMTEALEDALLDPSEPIRCRYTLFFYGDTTPQFDPPFELALTNVALTEEQMTATATRADVFSRRFPNLLYTTERFPGLLRR